MNTIPEVVPSEDRGRSNNQHVQSQAGIGGALLKGLKRGLGLIGRQMNLFQTTPKSNTPAPVRKNKPDWDTVLIPTNFGPK